MEALVIHPQIEIADDVLHDLAKGQGHNGQVVTPQPQHGNTDEKAHDPSQRTADHHGSQQPQGPVGNGIGQQCRRHHAAESTDAHKSGMAQAQLTADAHQQVQGHCQHHIGTSRNQEALHGAAELSLAHQQLEDQEGRRHHNIGGGIH